MTILHHRPSKFSAMWVAGLEMSTILSIRVARAVLITRSLKVSSVGGRTFSSEDLLFSNIHSELTKIRTLKVISFGLVDCYGEVWCLMEEVIGDSIARVLTKVFKSRDV